MWAYSINSYAALFTGPVQVNGNFTVAPGFAKSAGVKLPDGSVGRMYCQESPEPWFEDFGKDKLANGKTTVTLDKQFAAVVKNDDYSVFPVPEGDCKGLYVANQTPTSFEVRELQGGTSSIPFSYRVVARRKDDVGKRLEKITLADETKLKHPEKPTDPPKPSGSAGGPER